MYIYIYIYYHMYIYIYREREREREILFIMHFQIYTLCSRPSADPPGARTAPALGPSKIRSRCPKHAAIQRAQ